MQTQAGDGAQVVEGHLVWMPVVVADSRRDQGNPGANGVQQLRPAAGMRSVVANLQHVDLSQESALCQQRLDRHLRVSGEQRAEAAAAQQPDD